MDTQISVFVLDSDEETHKTFRNVGEKNSYSIDIATTAYEGLLRIVKGKLPDIFFIQSALPDRAGYEVCQVASKRDIAVVIVDHEATQDKVAKAIRSGAIDFLVKPASEATITKKIRNILERQGKIITKAKKFEGIDFSGKQLSALEKIIIILEKAQDVIAMPNSVAKVISLCKNERASASDIEKPLSSDPALSSLVLKRSKSVAYATVEPVKNLKAAITRIGVKETNNICVAVSVYKLFGKKDKSFGFNRFNYWIHCLGTAVIAQWIAKKYKFSPPEDALLVGLLHDIGKMILDDYIYEDYQKVVQLAASEDKTMQDAENQTLETTHYFIGGKIAEAWKFHQDVSDTIKNHHNYAIAFPDEGGNHNLVTFVYIGNYLAKAMMLGTGGDYFVAPVPTFIWSQLGFDKTIPDEFLQAIYTELKEFFDLLNIPKKLLPQKIDAGSKKEKVLMLSSAQVPNVFARVYLANEGYQIITEEGMGEDKEPIYNLIIYDCPEEISPDKKRFFTQQAKENGKSPAIFLQGKGIDIAEFQKAHKKVEVLSQPLDVFHFSQVMKNLLPDPIEESEKRP